MDPTTVGAGPFKPAIIFDDAKWVMDKEFATEADAYTVAHSVYTDLCQVIRTNLGKSAFQPRLFR